MGKKKKVTLTIDEDLWARCQILRRTAGANWSEVAEQAFSAVVETVDQLLVAHSDAQSSESATSFGTQALAVLEAHYQTAVSETHRILSEAKPSDISK
jgi:hypothetical protein